MNRYRQLQLFALCFTMILSSACGSKSFSQELRIVLLAVPPLVESLPLSPALKSGLVTDFTDIASHTAGLSECLSDGPDKPADLKCIQTFQGQVETIVARGHFGNANSDKLQRVLSLIRGIIASAIIYYGGEAPATRDVAADQVVTEGSIKAQIKELKEALKSEQR